MTYLANRLFLQGSFTHKNQATRRFERAQGAFAEPNVSELQASRDSVGASEGLSDEAAKRSARSSRGVVQPSCSLRARQASLTISHDAMNDRLPALHRVIIASGSGSERPTDSGVNTDCGRVCSSAHGAEPTSTISQRITS